MDCGWLVRFWIRESTAHRGSRNARVKPQSRTRCGRLPDHGLAGPVYISPMLYAMDQNDLLVLEGLIDDPVVAAPS